MARKLAKDRYWLSEQVHNAARTAGYDVPPFARGHLNLPPLLLGTLCTPDVADLCDADALALVRAVLARRRTLEVAVAVTAGRLTASTVRQWFIRNGRQLHKIPLDMEIYA